MSNRRSVSKNKPVPLNPHLAATRILVVDDDAAIRSLHLAALTYAGYSTGCAGDGAEALAILAFNRYDLVLTDRKMPRLDGLGLVRELRAIGNHIRVMMVSGSLTKGGEIPEEVRGEIVVALPKPATIEEILEGVERALATPPASSEAPLNPDTPPCAA